MPPNQPPNHPSLQQPPAFQPQPVALSSRGTQPRKQWGVYLLVGPIAIAGALFVLTVIASVLFGTSESPASHTMFIPSDTSTTLSALFASITAWVLLAWVPLAIVGSVLLVIRKR